MLTNILTSYRILIRRDYRPIIIPQNIRFCICSYRRLMNSDILSLTSCCFSSAAPPAQATILPSVNSTSLRGFTFSWSGKGGSPFSSYDLLATQYTSVNGVMLHANSPL